MFSDLIEKLRLRHDLTEHEASSVMTEIMTGSVSPAQIAGFLVALSMKGERLQEVVGFARTMRTQATQIARPFDDVFDTCGTGGDGKGTFNVSSLSAVVLAACGVRVAKHGNRSVSSACGSADLFEALGVNVTVAPEVVEQCLANVGFGFFFAPTFHPSMRHASQARRDLGVRTTFNLLGPLSNPAGATRQVVGVPGPEYTDLIARALGQLGSQRAWVVHGADGLDEVSVGGYTKVSELCDGSVHTFYVHPSDFGVGIADLNALKVRGLEESLEVARRVLAGESGPARDFVVVNAAAGLFVSEHVSSLEEGVQLAATVLDNGRAAGKIAELVEASRETLE